MILSFQSYSGCTCVFILYIYITKTLYVYSGNCIWTLLSYIVMKDRSIVLIISSSAPNSPPRFSQTEAGAFTSEEEGHCSKNGWMGAASVTSTTFSSKNLRNCSEQWFMSWHIQKIILVALHAEAQLACHRVTAHWYDKAQAQEVLA